MAYPDKRRRADIAADPFDSARRHSSEVLALRREDGVEPVLGVGFDADLRAELPQGGGERDDVDDVGHGLEDSLSCYHDGGVAKAGFATCRGSEISTTSPEVSIEPTRFLGGEVLLQVLADALLPESPDSQGDGLTDS